MQPSNQPVDHKKGVLAVVGMFAFLSVLFLGPRLLAASITDPTWLIVIGVLVGAGVLWRKQLVRVLRSLA